MEVNDLVAIKSMLGEEPHGCYDDCYCQRGRINGAGATALAAGFAALGIVIFGGLGAYAYVNATQKTAAALAHANGQRISDTISSINQINQTLLNEVNMRQAGDANTGARIDVLNTISTRADANASAWANAQNSLAFGVLGGEYSRCPSEVALVSKSYCGCPATGCGCNG